MDSNVGGVVCVFVLLDYKVVRLAAEGDHENEIDYTLVSVHGSPVRCEKKQACLRASINVDGSGACQFLRVDEPTIYMDATRACVAKRVFRSSDGSYVVREWGD